MHDMSSRRPKSGAPPGPAPPGETMVVSLSPDPEEILRALGLTSQPTLSDAERHGLYKIFPGVMATAPQAAEQFSRDAERLGRVDIDLDALRDAPARHAFLVSREAALGAAHRNVREQRMRLESEVMGGLLSIARRVRNASRDTAGLTDRWGFLLGLLGAFFKRPRKAAPSKPAASDKPATSDKPASDKPASDKPASDKG